LWNSRKIFQKVTNALFPNKINGISALALARRPLIRHGEQVFCSIFSVDLLCAGLIFRLFARQLQTGGGGNASWNKTILLRLAEKKEAS
jgi:hypothetical protein